MTIAAIVDRHVAGEHALQAGAHAVLHKPFTSRSKSEFRAAIYSRMIAERHPQSRYAIRWLVAAKDVNDSPVPDTMTDISEAGIGVVFTGRILAGDLLNFSLLLPGTNQIIRFEVRVLWTLRDSVAGAEFIRISTAHSEVLHKWLQQKNQAKRLDSWGQNCRL